MEEREHAEREISDVIEENTDKEESTHEKLAPDAYVTEGDICKSCLRPVRKSTFSSGVKSVKRQRQIELVKICQCCESLKVISYITRKQIKDIITRLCKCTIKENCCCRKMEQSIYVQEQENEGQDTQCTREV